MTHAASSSLSRGCVGGTSDGGSGTRRTLHSSSLTGALKLNDTRPSWNICGGSEGSETKRESKRASKSGPLPTSTPGTSFSSHRRAFTTNLPRRKIMVNNVVKYPHFSYDESGAFISNACFFLVPPSPANCRHLEFTDWIRITVPPMYLTAKWLCSSFCPIP